MPKLFERVADAMGAPADGTSDGSRAVRAVQALLKEVGFPVISSIGLTEEHLDELATNALADYFISVSPEPWTHADVVSCYRQALAISER